MNEINEDINLNKSIVSLYFSENSLKYSGNLPLQKTGKFPDSNHRRSACFLFSLESLLVSQFILISTHKEINLTFWKNLVGLMCN